MGEGADLQSRRVLLKQFAPQYRAASSAHKRVLLGAFVQATGYHRRYGMWLLNHAEEVLRAPQSARRSHYGPEVQHALFLAWNAANRICAKRLIPFLPTLVEALERHGHLHLTEEYRSQETVLAALQRARTLFPFPILGIDTDNGGEFINEVVIAYCEQERISFTRGRPYLKNDQCFVEQKNGAIVRKAGRL